MELFDAVCSSGGQVFYPSTEEGIANGLLTTNTKTSYGLELCRLFNTPRSRRRCYLSSGDTG